MSNLPPTDDVRHEVRSGETLSGIAERNGITLDALLAANPAIKDPNRIQIGQVIIIPGQSEATGDEPVEENVDGTDPSTPQSPADDTEESRSIFLGFDRLEYPGDAFMRVLRAEAQVSWTGFYLAPAPSQGSTTWMEKRAFLKGLGFGFAPIYVGQQQRQVRGSHLLTAAQGGSDGENAVALAKRAGFPEASVLYLDIETGPPPEPALLTYYKSWVQGVTDNGFTPGVYCSHLLPPALLQHAQAVVWIFHLKFDNGSTFSPPLPLIDPSQSTFTGARMMQYAQQGSLTIGGRTLSPIDLDSSHKADPSEV
ncbi:MAG TPA: LysM peptidoglycan-binding domain-containing protein [Blastocatellia bacterium]|nr:LysM peptidoglycan-binding domain-containing protein [Blastocatellia bacterium]